MNYLLNGLPSADS